MRNRLLLISAALVGLASPARGQDSATAEPAVPARVILRFRDSLQLSEAQVSKLQTLAKSQVAALTRVTAAYLRADADLLDASRNDDIAMRRLALEKRAKVAIDGEIARLQADKDSRAVLTTEQRTKLQATLEHAESELKGERVALWTSLVAPAPLSRGLYPAERGSILRDSNQVRLRVLPSYADIFVDDKLIGTNFKQVWLTVGVHKVRFAATGCGSPIEQTIEVVKTGQAIIIPTVTIPGC